MNVNGGLSGGDKLSLTGGRANRGAGETPTPKRLRHRFHSQFTEIYIKNKTGSFFPFLFSLFFFLRFRF